jgi:hypothetical protein
MSFEDLPTIFCEYGNIYLAKIDDRFRFYFVHDDLNLELNSPDMLTLTMPIRQNELVAQLKYIENLIAKYSKKRIIQKQIYSYELWRSFSGSKVQFKIELDLHIYDSIFYVRLRRFKRYRRVNSFEFTRWHQCYNVFHFKLSKDIIRIEKKLNQIYMDFPDLSDETLAKF